MGEHERGLGKNFAEGREGRCSCDQGGIQLAKTTPDAERIESQAGVSGTQWTRRSLTRTVFVSSAGSERWVMVEGVEETSCRGRPCKWWRCGRSLRLHKQSRTRHQGTAAHVKRASGEYRGQKKSKETKERVERIEKGGEAVEEEGTEVTIPIKSGAARINPDPAPSWL